MNQTNNSILTTFPEYQFRSTTLYNQRAGGRKLILAYSLFCGNIIGMILISAIFFELIDFRGAWYHSMDKNILCGVVILAYVVIITALNIRWYSRGVFTSSFADYIQSEGKMRFFVKNGKFGLVKGSNFKIIIPAIYDKLSWLQQNEVMKTSLNGEDFLIDIFNNKLN